MDTDYSKAFYVLVAYTQWKMLKEKGVILVSISMCLVIWKHWGRLVYFSSFISAILINSVLDNLKLHNSKMQADNRNFPLKSQSFFASLCERHLDPHTVFFGRMLPNTWNLTATCGVHYAHLKLYAFLLHSTLLSAGHAIEFFCSMFLVC